MEQKKKGRGLENMFKRFDSKINLIVVLNCMLENGKVCSSCSRECACFQPISNHSLLAGHLDIAFRTTQLSPKKTCKH